MTQPACRTTLTLLFLALALPVQGQDYYLYSPKPVTPEEKGRAKDDILVREILIKKGDTLSGISRKFSGRGLYYPQILLFNDIKNPDLIYTGNALRVPLGKDASVKGASKPTARGAGTTKKSVKKTRRSAGQTTGTPERANEISKQRVTPTPSAIPPITVRAAEPTEMELSLEEAKQGQGKKRDVKKKTGKTETKPIPREHQYPQPTIVTPETTAPVTSRPPAATTKAESSSDTVSKGGQKLYEQGIKAYRRDDYHAAIELFDRFLENNASSPLAADASLYKAECYLKLSTK